MDKIYRYRRLGDLGFKELKYQEIYFANKTELEDNLDMDVKIDYSTNDIQDVKYLIYFAIRSQFTYKSNQRLKFKEILETEDIFNKTCNYVLKDLINYSKTNNVLLLENIVNILSNAFDKISGILLDKEKFINEIETLLKKFFNNSYIACFSTRNDNTYMWENYADDYKGICLEFEVKYDSIAFEQFHDNVGLREPNDCIDTIERNKLSSTRWSGRLSPVLYGMSQSPIKFYEWAELFEKKDEPDVSLLNRSWVHKYAWDLDWLFCHKTLKYKEEEEYRIININFDNPKFPEERIYHYPIEILSAVYFGNETSENDKERVYELLNSKNSSIKFFESEINVSDKIEFNKYN